MYFVSLHNLLGYELVLGQGTLKIFFLKIVFHGTSSHWRNPDSQHDLYLRFFFSQSG